MKNFMKIFSKLLNCENVVPNNKYCSVPEIIFEKSGENNILYDINHQIVYLNKYGIPQFL